jgi:hypothetical protein
MRLASLTALAAVLSLTAASPALADSFTVTGTVDVSGSCSGTAPTRTCTTLRAAVAEANANNHDPNNPDQIVLATPGAYRLNDTLALTDDVEIIGQGPRATQIDGESEVRVLDVGAGVRVQVLSVAIQNGNAGTGDGGNIINRGDLTLFFAQVAHGNASSGGGIANLPGASLGLLTSVVDHNTATFGGGGIDSGGVGSASHLEVASSTIAFNSGSTGGGIMLEGTGDASILDTTIAWNTSGGGFGIASGAIDTELYGSLLSRNSPSNCSTTAKPIDEGYNLDDANSCTLDVQSGSKINADPELSGSLQDAGGYTDVLTFQAGSAAVDMVAFCFGVDQRGFQRGQPCDAGAYEQSAQGPPTPTISSGPPESTPATSASFSFAIADDPEATFVCQLTGPGHAAGYLPCTSPQQYAGLAPGDYVFAVAIADPTGQQPSGAPSLRAFRVTSPAAQTPAPTPTPTPVPVPTPVPQHDATGKVVSGTVLVKLPGGKFAPLDPTKPLPSGTEVDVTKGKIELTAVLKKGGKPEKATFYDGIFKLKLGKTTTDLVLSQPLAPCGKGKAGAAAKKPKTRKLWGNGSGSFRTRGQYSAATVRGTQWLVQDSCAGTLTKVTKGVVSVFDQVKKRTIVLRAGKSYLAKPRR